MSTEKYTLIGIDGNAFAILGYVSRCMRYEKFTKKEIDEYLTLAKMSDYSNLIYVSDMYIQMCNKKYNNRTSKK